MNKRLVFPDLVFPDLAFPDRALPDMASRRERGGVSVWILVMLMAVIMFLGITWDAGNILALEREADNIAASAARAGAQSVVEGSLYLHNTDRDGRVQLNQTDARERARIIGEAQGAREVRATFSSAGAGVGNDVIVVTVLRDYEPTFLAIFGFGTIEVQGEATVRARSALRTEVFDDTTIRSTQ